MYKVVIAGFVFFCISPPSNYVILKCTSFFAFRYNYNFIKLYIKNINDNNI